MARTKSTGLRTFVTALAILLAVYLSIALWGGRAVSAGLDSEAARSYGLREPREMLLERTLRRLRLSSHTGSPAHLERVWELSP